MIARRAFHLWVLLLIAGSTFARSASADGIASRLVILKVDGLNADLLFRTMDQKNPLTGKSRLPWFSYIFSENGVVFQNFYTRGISLSAPSWSMLDTGQHGIIRGNVEYDRFTGKIYDYLNFFPFYIGYARSRRVDMPAVEVLDRAGIPLIIDSFPYPERFQSFQLFQRGVRWTTLEHALRRKFSSKALMTMVAAGEAPSFDEVLGQETEQELKTALAQPQVLYLDYFIGDIDHITHETNQPNAIDAELSALDSLAGRIWSSIRASTLADRTLFVVVSDHGMNNVPSVFSQTFSLPDLLNSPAAGAHHVLTNRHQLSDYKIRGLDPMVRKVINPSTASFYLAGESSRYPTAWLDIDGNERAAVHLRNNDLNRIHILLQQLARPDLPVTIRRPAAEYLQHIIDAHRSAWDQTARELDQDMTVLQARIEDRRRTLEGEPKKWTQEERSRGEDKAARRLQDELRDWEEERSEYVAYAAALRSLLAFKPDAVRPFGGRISDLVPPSSLGENNSVGDLQHYVVGPASGGLVIAADGELDEQASFRHVDYFSLLAAQRVRNNPQPALSDRPIDFVMKAVTAPSSGGSQDEHKYWLYGDNENQLLIHVRSDGLIRLDPVASLTQASDGLLHCEHVPWRAGLPLHLFEDPQLALHAGVDPSGWLSEWHTEREWLNAIHKTHYSVGVISVIEDLSPVAAYVPGPPGADPKWLEYERRRRELVQPDFQVFATDHWNFNVRFPNPGGNHGSFLRISTHSVWMMAGAGLPARRIEDPYDTLSFASTVLSLLGRKAPMPDRVVKLN